MSHRFVTDLLNPIAALAAFVLPLFLVWGLFIWGDRNKPGSDRGAGDS